MILHLRISFRCSGSQKEAQKQSIVTPWRRYNLVPTDVPGTVSEGW
jgi:hypothetical protein